jgi:hypothetical protein
MWLMLSAHTDTPSAENAHKNKVLRSTDIVLFGSHIGCAST